MSHYACTGTCHGMSETPGTCQAADCTMSGKPLNECHCSDGKHSEMMNKDESAQ